MNTSHRLNVHSPSSGGFDLPWKAPKGSLKSGFHYYTQATRSPERNRDTYLEGRFLFCLNRKSEGGRPITSDGKGFLSPPKQPARRSLHIPHRLRCTAMRVPWKHGADGQFSSLAVSADQWSVQQTRKTRWLIPLFSVYPLARPTRVRPDIFGVLVGIP